MQKVDQAVVATLRKLCRIIMQETADSDDRLKCARVNREFHFAVFDVSGTPYLRLFFEHLWDS